MSRKRVAQALWIAWAILVWNVVFDRTIVVAGRQYLSAARAAASAGGSAVNMDDWMRPAVARGLWLASAVSATILLVGLGMIRIAASEHPDELDRSDRRLS